MKIRWQKRNARLNGQILILLIVTSAAWNANAADWHREVVDTSGGKYSSLQIDRHGNAHVVYLDDSQNLLKYSFWDHKLDKWFTTTLDSSAGFCSMILDSQQRPHVSYIQYGNAKIGYAYWDGSSWQKQTIQIKARDISFYTSITLDADDRPSISFYEYWGTGEDYLLHLRNVTWNGKFWEVRTVDSTPGSGKFNSITTDSTGNRRIAYANVKSENAGLRYARWNGQSWDVEVLEGSGSEYSIFSVAIALDKNDNPHITYADVRNRLIKYATRRDGKWKIQVADSVAQVAYPDRNGIAVDDDGHPYISYYDAGLGVLKLAHLNGQKWVTEVVDENLAGFTSSLQITNGTVWLTYADENSAGLKFAYRPLDEAGPTAKLTGPSKP